MKHSDSRYNMHNIMLNGVISLEKISQYTFLRDNIINYCRKNDIPTPELLCLESSKEVQVACIGKQLSPLTRLIFSQTGDPESILSIVSTKQAQDIIIQSYNGLMTRYYDVPSVNSYFSNFRLRLPDYNLYHYIITIFPLAVFADHNGKDQRSLEEKLAFTTSKCLRALQGKGPEKIRVTNLCKYVVYTISGSISESMKRYIKINPGNAGVVNDFICQSVASALEETHYNYGIDTCDSHVMLDIKNNTIVVLVEKGNESNSIIQL